MSESVPPFATKEQYLENGFSPVPETLNVDALLARASRKLLAEAHAAGVDLVAQMENGQIDVQLVADVVCEMVESATATGGAGGFAGAGLQSMQHSTGPFQQTLTFSDAVGRLYVGRDARRTLGLAAPTAFTAPLVGDAVAEPHPLDWLL